MRTTTKVAATDRANEVERFDDLAPTTTSGDYIKHDGTDNVRSAAAPGSGDVVGPGSATDNAIVRFDTTTGKLIQNSALTLNDFGQIEFVDDATEGLYWYNGVSNEAAIAYDGTTDTFYITADGVATGNVNIACGASGSVIVNRFSPSDTGGANHVLKQASAGGLTSSGLVVTANITDANVTYAKIQDVSAASKLLGRGSAGGSGDVEEITVGTNLTMSGTTLSADTATKHKTRVATIRLGAPQTNEKWPLLRVGDAFTLVKVTHKTTAGTCPFNLEYHSTIGTSTGDVFAANKTAGTTQTDETSFTDATGAADAWVVLSVEADPSTDVGVLDVAVEYTVD